ncbi:MAG: lysostaphin resistance A-like protein [Thermoleophilaceae bacterium]
MDVATPPVETGPPESAAPRWPWWYALAGCALGVLLVGLVVLPATAILSSLTDSSVKDPPPGIVVVGTLLQDAALLATAILLARRTMPPKPWHFGLRSTRLWPAVGWAALGMATFFVLSAVYAVVVQPDVQQRVTEELGADRGAVGLILAGVVVVAVAPVMEELFFRGFLYRALRSSLRPAFAAAIVGVVFGLIHWGPGGAEGGLVVPPLAVLGFIFCIVFERTGSLYPVIAMHALNNALAYGAQADGWPVSVALGPLMIAACVLLPRLAPSGPRPLPA